MANKKAWMTADFFKKWFYNCFAPEVQKYLERKGLEFKVLLVVDNAPRHPILDHPNIQLQFIPPNTSALIQPLDQGIIATFKAYYIKQAFQYITHSIEEGNMTVMEAWKKYTIMDCILHASSAVKQLQTTTLNACWKAIWPECVKSDISVTQESIVCSEIKIIAQSIGGEGFEDMQSGDIVELMIERPLDDEELIDLMDASNASNSSNNEEEDEKELSAAMIYEGLQFATSMAQHFLNYDPDVERALKLQRELQICVTGYEELYKHLQKPKRQQLITHFF